MKFSNPYPSVLNEGNLLAAADVTLSNTQYLEAGRYTVPWGEAIQPGFGGNSAQSDALGRIYMNLQRAAGAGNLDGYVRIEVHDALDNMKVKLYENRTEDLRTLLAAPSRADMVVFPAMNYRITPQNSIVVYVKADTNAHVLDVSASPCRMSVVRWSCTI